MLLDKALILKGVAGVTAVGSLATGGIVFRKELGLEDLFSSSSENDADKKVIASEGSVNTAETPSGESLPGRGGITTNTAQGSETHTVTEGQSKPGQVQESGPVTPSAPAKVEKTEEDKKKEKKEAVNAKLGKLGLSECLLDDVNLTSPTTFSKDCVLNQEKLQKIHFSNRGNNNVTVDGWGSDITLNISNKQGNDEAIKYTFKNVNSKLFIVGASGNGVITLPKGQEREFEEKPNGKLSKIPQNTSDSAKLKELNKKLSSIKIPERCWFDEAEKDETIDCDLSNKNDDLKKIEFSNKEWGKDSIISGSTNNLKLTINIVSADEAKLKYDYPTTDLEFIFSGYSQNINIKDNRTTGAFSDLVLKKDQRDFFTISKDTMSPFKDRLSRTFIINNLSGKMGLSCTATQVPCTPSGSDRKIRIFTDEENLEEIEVQKSQENDQIMCVVENANGFEFGFKYTAKKSFPSNSPKLQVNAQYQAKYVKGKGWGLVKKT